MFGLINSKSIEASSDIKSTIKINQQSFSDHSFSKKSAIPLRLHPVFFHQTSNKKNLELSALTYNPISLTINQELVYFQGDDYYLYSLDIEKYSTKKIYPLSDDLSVSSLIDGDNIILATKDGKITKLSLSSNQVLWQQSIQSYVNKRLIKHSDSLYVVTGDGKLLCLDYFSGKTKWLSKLSHSNQIGILQNDTINIIPESNMILVGDFLTVQVFDLSSGQKLGEYQTPGADDAYLSLPIGVVSPMLLFDDIIMFARSDGYVFAF